MDPACCRPHSVVSGVFEFDMQCFQKYGKTWGIYDGRQPVLAIMDPAIVKIILVKECYTYFTNRRNFGVNGALDSAITIAQDDQWKRIRTVISPTFTSGKLKEMFPIISHYGSSLRKNAHKKMATDEPVNMKDLFGAYSMDVVSSTSFSVNIDSLNNPSDPFVTHIKKALKLGFFSPLILIAVIFPFFIPVLRKMDISFFPKDILQFFLQVTSNIKDKRQKNNHTDRVDFMQLMVDSQITDDIHESDQAKHGYKALTDSEIMAQALVFIFAGYETTSTSLTLLSYNLATHPEIQKRLQEELDRVLPNKAAPTYDSLMQMDYLDMVINENLRLFPPGGRLDRMCKKTIEINGVTIPGGTLVMIPAYVMHRDPEYWPDPETFDPERFSKEKKEARDPYTFLPFGAGPRNCIGMRFALLAMKVAMAVLLQNFSFQTCQETPIPLEFDPKGVLRPKKPIVLKFIPRECTVPQE
ncbi:cytochrome P450 3A29-like isoform X2 [Ambystoma mexicanum]|uniref:cytochrome P450 3A29-like isoform X2 n=1 Tax=Ambystoma mexicanum TaxID=8296 RepID=UPI0037E8A7A0